MRRQQGYTFWGLTMVAIAIVFVAIIGMKLTPAYIEYFTIKKALTTMKNNGSLAKSKQEIKTAFDHITAIDNIKSVKSDELEITRDEAGNTAVSAEYQVVVPLVGNVSALLDFSVSTEPVAETSE